MNRKRITVLGGLALGCGLLAVAPAIAGAGDTTLQAPAASSATPAAAVVPADFQASLSGGQETPGNASPAFGQAQFWIGADGTSLSYSARIFGLANPVAAHLHLGPAGTAGPIVVPLQVPDQPGTSGCVAVISGGITQLPPTTGSSTPTSGEDACAAVVPPSSPTTPTSATTPTTNGSTTTEPTTSSSDGSTTTIEGSSSTSGVTTSTAGVTTTTMAMPMPTTSPGAAVTFRPEDEACRTVLWAPMGAPTTSTTEGSTSTSEGSTSSSSTSSSSTSSGPLTTTTAASTMPDSVCGFADVSGTISDSDLTGPLAGETVADLITEIRAGNIYVNFHSMAFPAGEIRGQLVSLNPPASTTTTTAPTTSTSEATTSTTGGATTSTGPTTSTTEVPTTLTTLPSTTTSVL